ncbi:MAG TPA: hypothetical protein VFW21_13470 [Mycobacterium sp.]|nr:hypothetical protein [Mycobacterium sp.]
MTYAYPPPPPPAKPPANTTDMVVSVIAMALTVLGGAGAAFMGLMMMAFTDYCPPATCNVSLGVNLMFAGFLVAAGIAVAGIVLTVIRLVRRRAAWPFAVCGLMLTGAACVLVLGGYITAVS